MLDELRRILAGSRSELSSEELLDALWLAARLPQGASSALAGAAASEGARSRGSGQEPAEDEPTQDRPAVDSARPSAAEAGSIRETPSTTDHTRHPSELHAAPAPGNGAVERAAPQRRADTPRPKKTADRAEADASDRPAVPVRSPEEKALAGVELRLGRALRPLKQLRPDPHAWDLDIAATVSAMAETGLPDAVLRPARTRWLDLVLLVDDGISMLLWQRLVTEFRLLLVRSGAFRTVRVHGLDSRSPGSPKLGRRPYEADPAPLPPAALTDPTGHTLLLVISDGVGPAWRDGRMHAVLEHAAKFGPTAVLHALPQRLWDGSGIRAQEWQVTTRLRGAPNRTWQVRDPVLPPDLAPYRGVPVPVLAPSPESVGAWAALVGSPGTTARLSLMAPMGSDAAPRPYAATRAPAGVGLLRFRDAASPQAYRLAAHLAAVAPVSVPAMRLVQEALDPEIDAGHLAEVFLGGLMRRLPAEGELLPQHQWFDFAEDTRRILLDTVPPAALVRSAGAVSARLAELADANGGFPAWMPHPSGADLVRRDGQPFGWVDERLLRRLGVPGRSHETTSSAPAVPQWEPDLPFVGRPGSLWVPVSPESEEGDPHALGPYRIVARFRGGSPSVRQYLASHDAGRRLVLIRSPRTGSSAADQAACAAEEEVLARLENHRVPRLLEVGSDDGHHWLAVEYLSNPGSPEPALSLSEHVRRHGALSRKQLLSYATQLALTVAVAHQREVVHGVLSPHKVLVVGEELRLTGWSTASVDGSHSAYWTPLSCLEGFRAPELQNAQAPTKAGDVFALGRALMSTVAAQPPNESFPIDDALRQVLRACTATSPQARPTADEVLTALTVEGDRSDPRESSPPEPAPQGESSPPDAVPSDETLRFAKIGLGYAEDGTRVALDLNASTVGGMGPHGVVLCEDDTVRHQMLAGLVRHLAGAHPEGDVVFLCAWYERADVLAELAELPQAEWAGGLALSRQGQAAELRQIFMDLLSSFGSVEPKVLIVLDNYHLLPLGGLSNADDLLATAYKNVHLLIGERDRSRLTPGRRNALSYEVELTGSDGGGTLTSQAGSLAFLPYPSRPDARFETLHEQGVALLRAGQFSDAYQHLTEAADGRSALHGPDGASTLDSVFERAVALRSLGDLTRSLRDFQRVHASRGATLGRLDPTVLDALEQIAFTLNHLARHDESLDAYLQLLAGRTADQGDRHPDTLRCRHNLAYTYRQLGRADEALTAATQAYDARLTALGADHADTLDSLEELGHIQAHLGEWTLARSSYEQVYAGRNRTLGAVHPDTLSVQQYMLDAAGGGGGFLGPPKGRPAGEG
ncbi:tetratricopeptide repeat protein [Streptomyces sp. YC504]|uniref:Tetratricopeptide repeat protein n=1 Tax=Streptomyces mesophilus TaxID=1775132 RepID=A0A6G4XAS4_9ACTN|nr:tetratricopeptide repeat-containing protein kinase family protein [Streptomyces mesophilus]NGO74625.1 tetratricopeptide repeat protein [Streptomyces mesophilus]